LLWIGECLNLLVSHTKEFIYLKTVKTGGTSTEVLFQPFCMPTPISVNDIPEWLETELVSEYGIVGARGARAHLENTYFNHMSGAALRGQVNSEVWTGYLKFANIRNPWAKTLSHFFYAGISPTIDRQNADVSTIRHHFSQFALGYQLPAVEGFFRSQLDNLDFYIRYENLEADIEKVQDLLGIQPEVNLPKFKTGFRPTKFDSYAQLFTPAARDHIGDVYNGWISQFNYRF
jgi:hypothetical protein